jgi:hypothetical protein
MSLRALRQAQDKLRKAISVLAKIASSPPAPRNDKHLSFVMKPESYSVLASHE